jgi:hypothetical protein
MVQAVPVAQPRTSVPWSHLVSSSAPARSLGHANAALSGSSAALLPYTRLLTVQSAWLRSLGGTESDAFRNAHQSVVGGQRGPAPSRAPLGGGVDSAAGGVGTMFFGGATSAPSQPTVISPQPWSWLRQRPVIDGPSAFALVLERPG